MRAAHDVRVLSVSGNLFHYDDGDANVVIPEFPPDLDATPTYPSEIRQYRLWHR